MILECNKKFSAYLDGLDCLLKCLGALSAAHQGRGPMSYGVGFTNPPGRVVADPPRSNAATVQCQSDRLLLRESAVCSRDSVRSFGPRRGPAGTGSAPVRPPAAWHNFAHERLRSWAQRSGSRVRQRIPLPRAKPGVRSRPRPNICRPGRRTGIACQFAVLRLRPSRRWSF